MRSRTRSPRASGHRFFAILALGAGLVGGPTPAAFASGGTRVAVLMSHDTAPFQEVLEGFRRTVAETATGAEIEVYRLEDGAAPETAALDAIRSSPAAVVLTLGSRATKAAAQGLGDRPIVAGLIMTAGEFSGAVNATGVVLEFPTATEFEWIERLLPGMKSIGVVYNPGENQGRIDAAAAVARSHGLSLKPRKVSTPKDLPDALESLAPDVDVLWGVADGVVLTPQTAKPILLFSLKNRIPFIGLSETWVKAGALYALDRDYADIGAQCAEIALRILAGEAPRSIRPAAPRKAIYSINMKTARLLKVEIPDRVLASARSVIE